MRSLVPILFFIICLCVGFKVNERSWNGQLFVYVGEDRAPAAVRALEEYSSLDHKVLSRSVHAQLLAAAGVLEEPTRVGVSLGHPLVNRSGGGKEFGCQVQEHSGAYDHIEMIFTGTGVSEGGESPHMIVRALCRSQNDLNQLDTIWIPKADMLAAGAHNQTLMAPGNTTVIQLESMPDQWPDSWVLLSVRLYRENEPEESLMIDASKIRQARPELLSINWKDQK